MKKVYCDFCGKEIVETGSWDDNIGGKIIFAPLMKQRTISFDACGNCFDDIKILVSGLIKTTEDVFAGWRTLSDKNTNENKKILLQKYKDLLDREITDEIKEG